MLWIVINVNICIFCRRITVSTMTGRGKPEELKKTARRKPRAYNVRNLWVQRLRTHLSKCVIKHGQLEKSCEVLQCDCYFCLTFCIANFCGLLRFLPLTQYVNDRWQCLLYHFWVRGRPILSGGSYCRTFPYRREIILECNEWFLCLHI